MNVPALQGFGIGFVKVLTRLVNQKRSKKKKPKIAEMPRVVTSDDSQFAYETKTRDLKTTLLFGSEKQDAN